MPSRVLSAGVLGPRPGSSPQQTYFTGSLSLVPGAAVTPGVPASPPTDA
jgi:hypothetical protein